MTKKLFLHVLSFLFITTFVVGCASTSKTSETPLTDESRIVGDIPSDSKFAKISIGMPMKQVYDLIGLPTDTASYITGKTFIPFYFGSDGARTEAIYKGEGRITFTGGAGLSAMGGKSFKVYRIVYDPTEIGYNM